MTARLAARFSVLNARQAREMLILGPQGSLLRPGSGQDHAVGRRPVRRLAEGRARIFAGAPDPYLAAQVAAGYRAKYEALGYAPQADQWDQGGLFEFTPVKGMAWTKFPDNMTRWMIS